MDPKRTQASAFYRDIPTLLGFIPGFRWDIPHLIVAYVLFWGPKGVLQAFRRTVSLTVLHHFLKGYCHGYYKSRHYEGRLLGARLHDMEVARMTGQ